MTVQTGNWPAVCAAVGVALAMSGANAAEVTYPTKPIRMIVPVTPGGGGDITSRAIAGKLVEAWGQQVIIDNRPGAGGLMGLEITARARPDGYTMSQAGIGPLTVTPSLQKNVPYNPLKDFAPIGRAVSALNVLVVHPTLPVKSVAELITHAKANPDKLSFGSSGAGRADHLAGELFNRMAGVRMQHVPYKGGAPAMLDLVAGNIPLIFATVSTAAASIKAARIRPIALTSSKRSDILPGLPTVAESGVPGFAVENWYGFVFPAGTPRPIVLKAHAEMNRALHSPEVKARLEPLGIVPFTSDTPEDFGAYIRSEMKKYAELVKAAGLSPE